MTEFKHSTCYPDRWRPSNTGQILRGNPVRPAQPESRIEDDAVLLEDDDPWLDGEETEDEGASTPRRPFWNR